MSRGENEQMMSNGCLFRVAGGYKIKIQTTKSNSRRKAGVFVVGGSGRQEEWRWRVEKSCFVCWAEVPSE